MESYRSSNSPSLSIVIPFYNEEESIEALVTRLTPVLAGLRERFGTQLVLVDDGSVDGTYASLRRHFGSAATREVTIVRHLKNRGLGAAMRTGFEAATGDIICTMDSDCTYAPEELPRMIEMLIRGGADIVTGSPYHPEGSVQNVPQWRLALSKGASSLYGLVLETKLYCYTSFFRAYRRSWARTDLSQSDGFLAVTETLVSAVMEGANVLEFPVNLGVREYGQSKMKVAKVTSQHLGLLGRLARINLGLSENPNAAQLANSVTRSEDDDPDSRTGLPEGWVLVGRVGEGE